jgi:hypothetical protein
VNQLRATLLLILSIAVPVGFVAARGTVSCNTPGYESFDGRLVEMHGTTATYVVASVVGGDSAASTATVGRRRAVRYDARDAARLRVGTTYRVEINGGGPGIDSTMNLPCSAGTTFTDGSPVVTRTWWQRNHVALGIVAAVSVALVLGAVWIRRRMWARGEIGRLAA